VLLLVWTAYLASNKEHHKVLRKRKESSAAIFKYTEPKYFTKISSLPS